MRQDKPIVLKLQSDCLNRDVPVVDLLRLAKIIATKLDLRDALVWIGHELNGYQDITMDDLPEYRKISGEPKCWNLYHGWQPIFFETNELAERFSIAPIGQAVGVIEQDLREDGDGVRVFPYPPTIKSHLMKAIGFQTEIALHLSNASAWNIVDQVRNLILNWTLELEKSGILGENMTFTEREKKQAEPASNQFNIQNVGVLGNVSGYAHVLNRQIATVTLDSAEVQSFLTQVRSALPLLPQDTRCALEPTLTAAESEVAAQSPDQSKLRQILGSIRSVCEGAAGNLAAQGMLALLRNLIG